MSYLIKQQKWPRTQQRYTTLLHNKLFPLFLNSITFTSLVLLLAASLTLGDQIPWNIFRGLNSIQSHKEVFSMTALSWLLILQAFNNLIMAIYTYMWAMVEIFLSTLKLLLYIPTLPKTFYTFWAYDKPIVTWYWTLVFLWC